MHIYTKCELIIEDKLFLSLFPIHQSISQLAVEEIIKEYKQQNSWGGGFGLPTVYVAIFSSEYT